MATKITLTLSQKSIANAIQQIKDYQTSLERKCEEFCRQLTEIGKVQAEAKISESPLGKYIKVTTDIIPQNMGCKAILFANGSSKQSADGSTMLPLMMVEFGSGIHYNGIPNPNADKFGMGVGTYPGQTHAFEDGWWYLGDDEQWHYTHGIKATMPMYTADIEMILKMKEIAKTVFRS